MSDNLFPKIGLEVHIELKTLSKMFCACPADHFSKPPNTLVCPICLGLPGALPFANYEAIKCTIALGLALGAKVSHLSKFDRKHYFYPDLPKGYQISQYENPLCGQGKYHDITIRRIHLEEDTAKLIHVNIKGQEATLIDFNRSGVPLLELVTEPDFANAKSASLFVKDLQTIVRYLKISDADMEKGSMRLEANISVSDKVDVLPAYKVELKNINSFRFLEKAINAEIDRQKILIKSGKKVDQETRGFDEKKTMTVSQRTKEEAKDYRYFPEPDIPPILLTSSQIAEIKLSLPELPQNKKTRFKATYNLQDYYIDQFMLDEERADYFEKAVKYGQSRGISAKTIADIIINKNLDKDFTDPSGLVKKLMELTTLKYASSKETQTAITQVLITEEKAVNDYKKGKTNVIGYLIGKVQRELKGKGNPAKVRESLEKLLKDKNVRR